MAARDWRSAAACRDVADAEIFFPAAEAGPAYEAQVAAAKTVCAGCPVQAECLHDALIRIPDGVAGGLSAEERRTYRAGRRLPDIADGTDRVIAAGLRPGARPSEVRAAGRVLLAAGRPVRDVAGRCRVTERTAARWQARAHAEGSAGGNRAPLLTSPTTHPLAGTSVQEGGRV